MQGSANEFEGSPRRVRRVASDEQSQRRGADACHRAASVEVDERIGRIDGSEDGTATSVDGLVTVKPTTARLVLSIREAAEALAVSDDLLYEMTAKGEIPCLQLGRRRLIPRRAVELLIERCLTTFDADAVTTHLRTGPGTEARGR